MQRIPRGNRQRFRKPGRIGFRCNEVRGAQLAAEWIELIEAHYEKAKESTDFRVIAEITETSAAFM